MFRVDLARMPLRSWALSGQSRAQCHRTSEVPLLSSTADELHVLYLAKGGVLTTAIEGNTLLEEEVSRLVKGVLELPPSKKYLGTEVDNNLQASRENLNALKRGSAPPITPERFLRMNQGVLKELALDPDIHAGRIRAHSMVVGKVQWRACAGLRVSDHDLFSSA